MLATSVTFTSACLLRVSWIIIFVRATYLTRITLRHITILSVYHFVPSFLRKRSHLRDLRVARQVEKQRRCFPNFIVCMWCALVRRLVFRFLPRIRHVRPRKICSHPTFLFSYLANTARFVWLCARCHTAAVEKIGFCRKPLASFYTVLYWFFYHQISTSAVNNFKNSFSVDYILFIKVKILIKPYQVK